MRQLDPLSPVLPPLGRLPLSRPLDGPQKSRCAQKKLLGSLVGVQIFFIECAQRSCLGFRRW